MIFKLYTENFALVDGCKNASASFESPYWCSYRQSLILFNRVMKSVTHKIVDYNLFA